MLREVHYREVCQSKVGRTKKIRAKQPVHQRRKLVAIMFTDMVGYTALGQRNESLSLALVNEQRKLLRPIFKRHNGREIDTIGDAFLVEFRSALDAARCSYDIQRATREFNISLPEDRRLSLRIGLHVGDVVESKGGDISGDAVNVASRVEPLAEAGGVCLTRQAYDHVKNNKFELDLQSFGLKTLKNVREPVEVFKMVMPWENRRPQEKPRRSFAQFPDSEKIGAELDPLRIAVLPFASMSPDPNDEYFADGMTEEMISKISLIGELSVISRTSVMGYKTQRSKKVSEIGKELNVGTLLEGSVRKVGNRIRITVQLIDVQTDKHLWSQNYDRNFEDIFAIQSEISESVADALKVKLLIQEKEKLQKKPTMDLEAYSLYMKGQFQFGRHAKEGYETAIRYYKQAIEKDRQFALAYSGIAETYVFLGFNGLAPTGQSYERAKEFAQDAVKIDEFIPEAHLALALVLDLLDWNVDAAMAECKRAIDLNPSLSRAHTYLAWVLRFQLGKTAEAIEHAKKALDLDPLSAWNLSTVGIQFLYAGRYDEAIEFLSKAVKRDANYSTSSLGLAYILKGQFDIGIPIIEEEVRRDPHDPGIKSDLAYAYVKAGRIQDARNALTELLELEKENHSSAGDIAAAYSALGDVDNALIWLERAREEQSSVIRELKFETLHFGNIRSDSRFTEFLQKIEKQNTKARSQVD